MARTTHADLEAQAEQALRHAVESLGHTIVAPPDQAGWDLTVTVDGIDVHVELAVGSVITPEAVARMIASADRRRTTVAHLVVGDLVTSAARDSLRSAGWGWLDRRGQLVLRADGIHIDAQIPPDDRQIERRRNVISGIAAISWAAALLLSPEDPPSMRGVARRASISHSAIVVASKRLHAASLVRADGRPLVPELFWALADEWATTPVALAETPRAGDADAYASLGVNLEGGGPGWAVAGTVGAVAWGAPTAIGSAFPPDFYVPSAALLRQATLRLGEAPRFEERRCTVALAPTPLVCAERVDLESSQWGTWRFAHGLYAALDLAQDRARGAEILDGWNPRAFTRVW